MAEIHQPTPVKPIWPTRRDGHPPKRQKPQGADEKKRQEPPGEDDLDPPHRSGIDEYA
jgi:hypothetical protein